MKNYLFRIYYDGSKYSGYQRQPNGQSVENYVEFAFIKCKYIKSFKKNEYRPCSRTDSGVTAISNLFSIFLIQSPILRYLNNFLPKDNSIIIWDFAIVSTDFNTRSVVEKHYSYLLTYPLKKIYNNIDRIFDFKGKNNFHNFIKKDGAGSKNPNSEIFHIDITKKNKNLIISFKGNKFGREQIRRMIGFILETRYIKYSPKSFLIPNRKDLHINSVNPGLLLLVDIQFRQKIKWFIGSNPINNLYVSWIENQLNRDKIQNILISDLMA